MADDALTYWVEAFGHYTEAEIEAFLAATPTTEAAPALPTDVAAEIALREIPATSRVVWA